jgi:hypothetical protein
LGSHGSQAGSGDNDPNKTGDVHTAPRVDLVMKPSTQGVVNKTCRCKLGAQAR